MQRPSKIGAKEEDLTGDGGLIKTIIKEGKDEKH
jgi:hypothetical protein